MTTTIGRCSLADSPSDMSQSGDSLGFKVDVWGDLDSVRGVRQQLLGLVDNPDEPVVPFTSTSDPHLDGFYRVQAINLVPSSLRFSASVTLQRVSGGWAKPLFEVPIALAVRSNTRGVTTVDSSGGENKYAVLPFGETSVTSLFFGPETIAAIVSASGDVQAWGAVDPVDSPVQEVGSFYAAPAEWYNGAAMVEVLVGATWHPWIGRHVPLGTAGGWRISNGFIRASLSTGTIGTLLIEVWNGSAWVTKPLLQSRDAALSTVYLGTLDYTSNADGYIDPVIVANGPDLVSVALSSVWGRQVTLSVRSGAPVVEWTSTGVVQFESIGLTTPAGVTAITEATVDGGVGTDQVGFYTTAASSTNLIVMSPDTISVDAVNGRISTSTFITRALIAATTPVTDGSTAWWDAVTDVVRDAWIAWTARRVVVAR